MDSELLDHDHLPEFRKKLLEWFDHAQRDFPWRHTHDPYRILVAEKLLQQTVVRAAVVRAYEEILRCYPAPVDLADADEAHLVGIIEPLGLVYRAREFITLGRELVDRHGGVVPDTMPDLLHLTGVGEYGARAIMSFAYGVDMAVVDTNVARFLYRVFLIQEPMPPNPARKKSLLTLAGTLLPEGRSRDFNLAILDLCAAVCKARQPLCDQCPVSRYCLTGYSAIHQSR